MTEKERKTEYNFNQQKSSNWISAEMLKCFNNNTYNENEKEPKMCKESRFFFFFFVKLFYLIALNEYVDMYDGSWKEPIAMITVTTITVIIL